MKLPDGVFGDSQGRGLRVDEIERLAVTPDFFLIAVARQCLAEDNGPDPLGIDLDSFDAVVCRWGLMFFQDPVGALARFRNSLVPGGWLAAAIWGSPERVPMISLPFSVLSRELGQPPSLLSGPNPFALSEPTRLEQVLREAGFAKVYSEQFTVTFEFASVDELLGHLGEVSAPIRMIMATSSPEYQAEFWKKLADAAVPFTDADGMIRLSNDCLVAAGQR